MPKVAIICCDKIRDISCVACAKCMKGAKMKAGEFGKYDDDVEIVGISSCGDCPGVIMPRLGLVNSILCGMDQEPDVIHLGTCVAKAVKTAACPIDVEKLKTLIKENFGKDLVAGTHDY